MRLCTLVAALVMAVPALAAPPDISQVNGAVSVDANHEAGNISTTNGPIHIGADSHIEGGILVRNRERHAALPVRSAAVCE